MTRSDVGAGGQPTSRHRGSHSQPQRSGRYAPDLPIRRPRCTPRSAGRRRWPEQAGGRCRLDAPGIRLPSATRSQAKRVIVETSWVNNTRPSNAVHNRAVGPTAPPSGVCCDSSRLAGPGELVVGARSVVHEENIAGHELGMRLASGDAQQSGDREHQAACTTVPPERRSPSRRRIGLTAPTWVANSGAGARDRSASVTAPPTAGSGTHWLDHQSP